MMPHSEPDVLQGRGRLVGILACATFVTQSLLLPGLRSLGSGKALAIVEVLAPMLVMTSSLFAWVFAVRGAYALAFPSALSVPVRVGLGGFAMAGLSIGLPAFAAHGSMFMLATMQFTGSIAFLVAGLGCLGARKQPGFRPMAVVLLIVAGASFLRFGSHVCFFGASDLLSEAASHPRFIRWGSALASAALALEVAVVVIGALVAATVIAPVTSKPTTRVSPRHMGVAAAGLLVAAVLTLLSLGSSHRAFATFFQIALGDIESVSLPTGVPGAVRFLAIWSPIVAASLLTMRFRYPSAALLALLCLSRGMFDVPAFYYFGMFGAFGVALMAGERQEPRKPVVTAPHAESLH